MSRETIQTLFPMTSAALEKKKKGEKNLQTHKVLNCPSLMADFPKLPGQRPWR